MDSEIRQIHRNFTQSSDCWLMHIFLTAKYVMDCLINLMNNKRFFPPLIISFSTNYNPLTYPIFILFTPCSDVDYS
jgi:hypothetical protein